MPSDQQLPADAELVMTNENSPAYPGKRLLTFAVPVSSPEPSLAERMAKHAQTSRERVFHPEDDMGIWQAQAQKMIDDLKLRSELDPGFPGNEWEQKANEYRRWAENEAALRGGLEARLAPGS